MKLIITRSEANDLIKLNLLEPIDSTNYVIRLKPDAKNTQRTINVELMLEDVELIEKNNSNSQNKINIDDFYSRIREIFPTNIQNEGVSRNLRTGNTDKIKSRIKELCKKYNFDDVINAAKYEVEKRIQSKELKFMKALSAWLNDEENIISQIENNKNNDNNLNQRNVTLFG